MEAFTRGLRLRMARFRLTQKETAFYLGVSPDTISSWLAGKSVPSSSALRLFEVLGILDEHSPELHAAYVESCRVARRKPGPAKGSTYIRWKRGRAVKSSQPGSVFATLGVDTRPWYER